MENAMIVRHDFKEIKQPDNEQETEDKNKSALICVGSTGTGKSSLIKLFCGNNVYVGHSVDSATKGSHLFKETISSRYWLDSQGANDSHGADDEKVLTDVLKKLCDNDITNIKVVWCISGDFDRAKQEFQTQAAFIKSLGDGVWNTCLIVQKKGPLEPDDIDGVLECARNRGANIEYGDKRLFGYTGLDYMDDAAKKKDRVLRKIMKKPDSKEREEELIEDGFLTNKQIVEYIEDRLGKLSSLKLEFTVKKCSKCGVQGDPRLVYAPCHPGEEAEKYHPKPTFPTHPGKITYFHPGGTFSRHNGEVKADKHIEWYHTGEIDDNIARNVISHVATASIATWIRAANDTLQTWSCCDRSPNSKGCKKREVNDTRWTCCGNSSGHSGCITKYGCCQKSTGSTGCRKEWDCCKAAGSNPGCQRIYECCKKDLDAEGCKDRCQSCHKTWGSSKGCIQTAKKL